MSAEETFGAITHYAQYASPLYWIGTVGRMAAQAGMSDITLGMMNSLLESGTAAEAVNRMMQQPATLAEGYGIGAIKQVMEYGTQGLSASVGVGGLGGLATLSTPTPVGAAFAFGMAGGIVVDMHKDMIGRLANSNAPGFEHKTVTVNGREVEIWIDASTVAEGGSEPRIYVNFNDGEDGTLGSKKGDPISYVKNTAALDAHIGKMTNEAIGGLLTYLGGVADANGKTPAELYAPKLSDALENGAFGAKIIHPDEPAPAPADVRSPRPAGSPVPAGPTGIY